MKKTSKFSANLAELRKDGSTCLEMKDAHNFAVYCLMKGAKWTATAPTIDSNHIYFFMDAPGV